MSDWTWFTEFEADAHVRGDLDRARLGQVHNEAFGYRDSDPDRALLLFAEGRRLAQALGEPWWELLFDHWTVHGTLYYKRDYRNVLDKAIRNVLEVNKPRNRDFPQRLWIFNDLVNIYLSLDPRGYSDEIEQTLSQAESELTPDMLSSRYLLRESRQDVALAHDRLDVALELTLQTRAQLEGESSRWTAEHYLLSNYAGLCLLYHLRKEWAEIGPLAEEGEAMARQRNYERAVGIFIMWQASSARRKGDTLAAGRLCRNAVARMGRLKTPCTGDYYDALCDYHEVCGNLARSLQLRDQELKEIEQQGTVYNEFDTRVKRLRLLIQMGRAGDADWEDVRAFTRRFRRPERYLPDVERLAGSSGR